MSAFLFGAPALVLRVQVAGVGVAVAAALGTPTVVLTALPVVASDSDAVGGGRVVSFHQNMAEWLAAIEEATQRDELLRAEKQAATQAQVKRRSKPQVDLSDERTDNEQLARLDRMIVATELRGMRLYEEFRQAAAAARHAESERLRSDIARFMSENRAALARYDAAYESRLRLDDEDVILALM